MSSNADLITSKLSVTYGEDSVNDLLDKFWKDQNLPTGQPLFGLALKLFYKPTATPAESLSSVERTYWENFNGGAVQLATLFGSAVPTYTAADDGVAYSMGTTFKSSVACNVTKLRFFRGTLDPVGNGVAQVTGKLWRVSDQAELASVNLVSGVTPDVWIEASITPVTLTADVFYRVSYHHGKGYAVQSQFFQSNDLVFGPLTAPDNAEAGGNGVFTQSVSHLYPSSSFNNASYFADVEVEY